MAVVVRERWGIKSLAKQKKKDLWKKGVVVYVSITGSRGVLGMCSRFVRGGPNWPCFFRE